MTPGEDAFAAAGSAGLGAAAGWLAVRTAGLTAAGMVGGGAGIGAAAGPVGAVSGATAGLALYGLGRVVWAVARSQPTYVVDPWSCPGCGHDIDWHLRGLCLWEDCTCGAEAGQ